LPERKSFIHRRGLIRAIPEQRESLPFGNDWDELLTRRVAFLGPIKKNCVPEMLHHPGESVPRDRESVEGVVRIYRRIREAEEV